MKPLATNEKKLIAFGLCSFAEGTSRREKWTCIATAMIFYFFNIFSLTTSGAYFFKYWSTDFEECLYGLLQFFALGSIVYASIVLHFQRHGIRTILEKLAKIYVASKVIFLIVIEYLCELNECEVNF